MAKTLLQHARELAKWITDKRMFHSLILYKAREINTEISCFISHTNRGILGMPWIIWVVMVIAHCEDACIKWHILQHGTEPWAIRGPIHSTDPTLGRNGGAQKSALFEQYRKAILTCRMVERVKIIKCAPLTNLESFDSFPAPKSGIFRWQFMQRALETALHFMLPTPKLCDYHVGGEKRQESTPEEYKHIRTG